MNETFNVKPFGDRAVYIPFGHNIDTNTHEKIQAFVHYLERHPFDGMIECVPAYTNVTVYYDPIAVLQKQNIRQRSSFLYSPYEIVSNYIEEALKRFEKEEITVESREVIIPVVYGGSFGPDLAIVAKLNDLTEEEVIRLHSEREYKVYMLGFAPGFPFLGGMDERLATPRKENPRLTIPAGSVGIAGHQTGIYPLETPGGWQIIGRTPLDLFLPDQTPPTLLQPGDTIRFEPIDESDYEKWKEER